MDAVANLRGACSALRLHTDERIAADVRAKAEAVIALNRTDELIAIVREAAEEATVFYAQNWEKCEPWSAMGAEAYGRMYGAKKALGDLLQQMEGTEMGVTTVRFPDDDDDDLRAVAEVEGTSVAEVVRSAVKAHIDSRRADPEFQRRLSGALDRNRRVLERLASE